MPGLGTYFVAYELIARALSQAETGIEAPAWVTLMAGGLAGATSWVVCYPTDVIKSRIQVLY